VLALLESGPLKAYELLDQLGRLFGPDYRPSPGGLYPAVTALVTETLIEAHQEGRAKRYAITRRGRAVLEQRRPQVAAIEHRTGARLGDIDRLSDVLARFTTQVESHAGQVDPAAVERVLDQALKKIATLRSSNGKT